MKRKMLVVAALIVVLLTAACGMSAEQIDSALAEIETSYQSGVYEQIPATLEKLDKAYNNMSDEQKSKFTELRPLVDNAVKNAPAIKEGLGKAQGNYDQKMYYEAQQELDKIKDYQMPPVEKTKYDSLQANVSNAIGTWKIAEALQKIEALYNSGDYDLAATTIAELDISAATEEQKQQHQSLQNKINNSKLLVQAEGEYNQKSYNSATSTISKIDTSYLTETQKQKMSSLKTKIADAKTITYDKAVQLVKNYCKNHAGYTPTNFDLNEETSSKFVIHAYEIISYPGEGSHIGSSNMISVDKKTGAMYDEILMQPIG